MSSFQVLKIFGHIFGGKMAAFGEAFGIVIFTLGLVLWMLIPLYDTDTKSASAPAGPPGSACSPWPCWSITTIWGYAALG